MKTKKLVIMAFLFIFIAISLTFLSYFIFVIDTIRIYPMDIELSPDAYGVNGDTDAIHFGKVALTTGAYATKFVKVANYKTRPSFVTVSFSGQMASWTDVSENNFVLGPGEEKELKFYARVPRDAVPGNYTGKAKIVMKRYFS